MSPLRNTRGMTLVEVMVTMAVAGVVIAAAAASIVSMAQVNRSSWRKSGMDLQSRLAMVYLERNLGNAGLNFPAVEFAFRVRNNVAEGTTISNGSAFGSGAGAEGVLDVVTEHDSPGGPVGVIAGTDVVEIAWSDPLQHRVGRVAECPLPGPSCVQAGTSSGQATLLTSNPFRVSLNPPVDEPGDIHTHGAGAAPWGPLLLFTNGAAAPDAQVSCLARATDYDVNTNVVSLRFMNMELAEENGHTAPPCPVVGMVVYALDGRQRFMVYRAQEGAPPGLYVQNLDTSDATKSVMSFGTPVLLAQGIEDMQVSPQLLNPAAMTGLGALDFCGDTARQTCSCNRRTDEPDPEAANAGSECTVGIVDDAAPGGLRSNPALAQNMVRGVTIFLSARSAEPNGMEVPGFNFRRYQVFDRTEEGEVDNQFRQGFRLSVLLMNGMVNQL